MLFKKKNCIYIAKTKKIFKNHSLLEKESPSVLDMLKFEGICMLWFWSEKPTLLLLFSLTNMLICMEF